MSKPTSDEIRKSIERILLAAQSERVLVDFGRDLREILKHKYAGKIVTDALKKEIAATIAEGLSKLSSLDAQAGIDFRVDVETVVSDATKVRINVVALTERGRAFVRAANERAVQ